MEIIQRAVSYFALPYLALSPRYKISQWILNALSKVVTTTDIVSFRILKIEICFQNVRNKASPSG